MGDIIHFPRAAQSAASSSRLKPVAQPLGSGGQDMRLGPWEFTCHRCGTKASFESQNMIFRSVDFYCSSCGAIHRVTNPAFSPTPKK